MRDFRFLSRNKCLKSPRDNVTFAVEPRKKVVVDLTMVFVEKILSMTRCFNYDAFGHIARTCQKSLKCRKCGKEGDKIAECRADRSRCGNCGQTGHRAYDLRCPTQKKAEQRKIARTAR